MNEAQNSVLSQSPPEAVEGEGDLRQRTEELQTRARAVNEQVQSLGDEPSDEQLAQADVDVNELLQEGTSLLTDVGSAEGSNPFQAFFKALLIAIILLALAQVYTVKAYSGVGGGKGKR